jgi:hypothetical protein
VYHKLFVFSSAPKENPGQKEYARISLQEWNMPATKAPIKSTTSFKINSKDPDFNQDLLPLEWQTVGLARRESYSMPERCVVCSSPAGSATIRTTHQQVSGRVRASLALDFPLCDKCKAVDNTFRRNSTLATLVAFGLACLGFTAFMLIMYHVQPQAGVLICPGLLGAAVLFALLLWFLNWAFGKRFPRAMHERQKRIDTAVRITSFGTANIFFQFSNPRFARDFVAVNKAVRAKSHK